MYNACGKVHDMPDKQESKKKADKQNERTTKKKKGRAAKAGISAFLIMALGSLLSVFLGFDPFEVGYGKNGPGIENVTELVDTIGDNINGVSSDIIADDETGEVTVTVTPAPVDEKETVMIRIEGTVITIGDVRCENAAGLKAVVTNQYNGKQEYRVIYTTAITEAYNEVKDVMQELKEALGLSVSYEK